MITLCLVALAGVAHAEPRVALVLGDAPAADVAVARVSLASSGFEVAVVDAQAAPYDGELAALQRTQREVRRAVDDARASFVATRYAEARTIAVDAEKRAASWAGEPGVARALAELALVAAQCGDPAGYAHAAAYDAQLKLDEARWSPTVRDAFARATVDRERGRRVPLRIRSWPAGATLFVDGIPQIVADGSTELMVLTGTHAIYVSGAAMMPVHQPLRLERAADLTVNTTAITDRDRASALRLRVASEMALDPAELASAAASLHVDALATLALGDRRAVVYAWAPGVASERPIEESGERGEAITAAMREAARRLHVAFSLSHTPPERARAGSPLELKIAVGPSVHQVTLSFFTTLGRKWEQRSGEVRAGEAAFQLDRAQLPSSDRPYLLEYYLSAHDARGAELATLRDATTPLRLPIDPDRERPHWYKKWWVWTIVGVVAAGAVTTAVVLTTRPPPDARLVGTP
jgi:hypothetical protein